MAALHFDQIACRAITAKQRATEAQTAISPEGSGLLGGVGGPVGVASAQRAMAPPAQQRRLRGRR